MPGSLLPKGRGSVGRVPSLAPDSFCYLCDNQFMMATLSNSWQGKFARHLSARNIEEALEILEARSTGHAGTPNATDKRAAVGLFLEEFHQHPEELWTWTIQLAKSDSATQRELACVLLGAAYAEHRTKALQVALTLVDDSHWEVRLWAAELVAHLFGQYFDDIYPMLKNWAHHSSEFVRVAVVTSVRDKGHGGRGERARQLIDLVEPLLSDRAHEVERNLGGFAIGDGLLRLFPERTLEDVRRWAQSDDEQVRWNVAMVFSAAEARKHTDVGLEILSELARDQRKKVWRAVASALRNLVKGDPDRVVPVVQAWLEDDRKLPSALALRGFSKEVETRARSQSANEAQAREPS